MSEFGGESGKIYLDTSMFEKNEESEVNKNMLQEVAVYLVYIGNVQKDVYMSGFGREKRKGWSVIQGFKGYLF